MSRVKTKYIQWGTGSQDVNAKAMPAIYSPSNYTPSQVSSEGTDKVSAHLKGIDAKLATIPTLGTNVATFLATPSSANLAAAITDETGTAGALVFSSSPTFTTTIFTPMVIGGTGTTSDLTFKATTGVGTTNSDIVFQVGSNGATEAMRIYNTGNVSIGGSALTQKLRTLYNVTDMASATTIIFADGTHTLTTNNALQYIGGISNPSLNQGSSNSTVSLNTGGGVVGYKANTRVTGASGTVTSAVGFGADVRNTGAGVLTNAVGFQTSTISNTGGGTLTNGYGFYANSQTAATNNYAFYSNQAAASGAFGFYSNGTAINYFAGQVGIGTDTPNASSLLELSSTTKGLRFPNLTTTQVNAVSTPPAGLSVFDTTLKGLSIYTGAAWNTSASIGARAHASATTISGTLATIVWTTEDYDTNAALASGVFTVPVGGAGKYQVNANIQITGTIALNSVLDMQLQKNGTAWAEFQTYAGGAMTAQNGQISDIINCADGDTIRIQVSSSATLPVISTSDTKNFFSIQRLNL